MSVESIGRALSVADARLSPADRFVLVCMANHDGDGGCWPAVATLARYTGLTVRSVQRCIGRLEQLGWVTREVGAGGTQHTRNDRRPNRYTLHLRGDTMSPRPANGVTSTTERGDIHDANGVTPVSPEPSYEPSYEPSAAANRDVFTRANLPPAAAAALDIWIEHRTRTVRPRSPVPFRRALERTELAAHGAELATSGPSYTDGDPVDIAVAVFGIDLGDALVAQQRLGETA